MIKVSHQLATTCRQRGVVRGSITSIQKWVTEFEALAEAAELSNIDRLTIEHLLQKLEKSEASFKEFHFEVLDLIDKAEQEDEQAILDEHDNKVADTTARIQQLLAETPKPEPLSSDSDLKLKRQLHERLDRIEAKLHAVEAATKPMTTGPKPNNCLLRQYEEQIAGFKSELTDISRSIISIKGGDKNLSGREITLDRWIFDVCRR